jgi:integrase
VPIDNLYPHALRATAANYWTSRGLDSTHLAYMLGWADQSTARKYIRDSPDRAAQAIYEVAP